MLFGGYLIAGDGKADNDEATRWAEAGGEAQRVRIRNEAKRTTLDSRTVQDWHLVCSTRVFATDSKKEESGTSADRGDSGGY